MSQVANCPTCGSKSLYTAVQDEEAFKKIGQLKKAMEKFKAKSEALEKELNELKASL